MPGPERASVETLHKVYSDILSCGNARLTAANRADLIGRGFPPESIEGLGYGSRPGREAWRIADGMADRYGKGVALTVPGLFAVDRPDGRRQYMRLAGQAGLLIPVRDVSGRIVAVSNRPDERRTPDSPKYLWLSSKGDKKGNGPGSGAPCHVPLGIERPSPVVRVTEGALKADLAQALSGLATVGVSGVGSWRPASQVLKELGAEVVRLAYDSDWRDKREVAGALCNLAADLKAKGFTVEVEVWDEADGKGIDDLLAAGHSSQVVSGDDAESLLLKAKEIADSKSTERQPEQKLPPIDGKAIAQRVRDVVGPKGETVGALFLDKSLLADLARLMAEDPDEFASIRSDLKGFRKFSAKDFDAAIGRNAAIAQSRPSGPGDGPEDDVAADDALEGMQDNPHRLARGFINERFYHPDPSCPDGRRIRTYQDELFYWKNSCYRALPDGELKAMVSAYIDAEFRKLFDAEMMRYGMRAKSGKAGDPPKLRGVTTRLIGDVVQAIKGETLLGKSDYPDQPCWIVPGQEWPADEVIATPNVLVHLPSLVEGHEYSRRPTAAFFNRNALGYEFDPQAPRPDEWLRFLTSIWPDDSESIASLQEWLGLLLVPDTSYQKILALIGPRRCGKGTICRIAKRLVGRDNVANPKLAQLATNFGLAPLIGKTAAIVTDAKLSGRTDQSAIIETLLSISGEDDQTIDRKYREAWNGRLLSRFMIVGNEFPKLKDSSEALPGRLVVLQLKHSFYGREDKTLTNKLRTELPGILIWAIRGWQRLRDRGCFVQPRSASGLIESISEVASPVNAFLRDCTERGVGFQVPRAELFARWQRWNKDKGREHSGSEETFGTDLRAAIPDLSTTQPNIDGKRTRCYEGLRILTEARAISKAGVWLKGYMARGDSRQRDAIQAAESLGLTASDVFQAARELELVEFTSDQKKHWRGFPSHPSSQETQDDPC